MIEDTARKKIEGIVEDLLQESLTRITDETIQNIFKEAMRQHIAEWI